MDNLNLVYDGSHLLHRMYHVTLSRCPVDDPDFDNAVYHTALRSILSDVRGYSPVSVTLLFDTPTSTSYRKSINPDYKGNREFVSKIPELKYKLKEYLSRINILSYENPDMEADDLAYLMSRDLDNNILFISGDFDWRATIGVNKNLYNPNNKKILTLDDLKRMYVNSVLVDYTPEMVDENLIRKVIVHQKSLIGDISDNVTGIRGIGEVRSGYVLKKIFTLYRKNLHLEDYHRNKKYEEELTNNLDRFKNNLRVLGYDHLDNVKLPDIPNPGELKDYESGYKSICNEIKSWILLEDYNKNSPYLKSLNYIDYHRR